MSEHRVPFLSKLFAIAGLAMVPFSALADDPVGTTSKVAPAKTIEHLSTTEMVSILQDNGYRAQVQTNNDQKYILSGMNGYQIDVFFYNCTKDDCGAIQFSLWGKSANVDAKYANDWNTNWRYTKIAMDTDGNFYLTLDVNLTGGVTMANVLAYLSSFSDATSRLKL